MRYVDFRDQIQQALSKSPNGMTWVELRDGLSLPYQRACPQWTRRLEQEIGLTRTPGAPGRGRGLVWRVGK